MTHTWQTRETRHADALLLAEIQEEGWYKFHYCFPAGRRTDLTNYEETWARARVVKMQDGFVTLQHGGNTNRLSLFELGMEPNEDGKYTCHHRLARL